MSKKEHLTIKGMEKIIKLASKMNTDRSFKDKYEYCNKFLGLTSLPNGEFETKYDLPAH